MNKKIHDLMEEGTEITFTKTEKKKMRIELKIPGEIQRGIELDFMVYPEEEEGEPYEGSGEMIDGWIERSVRNTLRRFE